MCLYFFKPVLYYAFYFGGLIQVSYFSTVNEPCVYKGCHLGCRSKEEHKSTYARMKDKKRNYYRARLYYK